MQSTSITSSEIPVNAAHPNTEEIPSNLYKPNAPLVAKLLENKRLTAENSPNDVRHLVFDLTGSNLRYVEGQSIGILPPGTDANGKPHKLRLYSIASAACGDDGQGQTVTLCVKRAITVDPVTGQTFTGVCSQYLCDLTPGESSHVTGPVGKAFLMPTPLTGKNLIMVATGTGIAPFRAFLRRRYLYDSPPTLTLPHKGGGDNTNPQDQETTNIGQSWLFFGAQTRQDYLYEDELADYAKQPGCHILTAFSREEKNAEGGRLYVQHRLQEHGVALFELLKQPETYFYICGLRGMEAGILEGLEQVAKSQGIEWNSFFEQLKAEKRWHVEVY